MGKQTIANKIKHIIFKLVCPIYLWSINMETWDDYLDEIERQYDNRRKEK